MMFQDSPKITPLSAILDLNAAGPLAAQLLSLRGGAVILDASRVSRLSGLCLQVLLSARTTWAADGKALQVAEASEAFDDALALFGAERFDAGPVTSS